jgi:hypothetical protein
VPTTPASNPKSPFVLMNHHHIVKNDKSYSINIVGEKAFHRGKFRENAVVIDLNCRKFPIFDVVRLGLTWFGSYWNPLTWPSYLFFRNSFDTEIVVKYLYGDPIQLTFDEARAEIEELICRRRWYGQTGETEKQFRKRSAKCKNMAEFLEGISFYGRWQMHYVPRRQKAK